MSYFERRGSSGSVEGPNAGTGLDAAKSFFKRGLSSMKKDKDGEKESGTDKDATAKVLDFFRVKKDEKKTPDRGTEPVKLVLKASSARDAPISAIGAPADVAGRYKWYKIKEDQKFVLVEEVTEAKYYPSVDDLGARLCCQWVPHDGGLPSSFAEVGPLTADLNVTEMAQNLYATGNATFPVDVPNATDEQQIITLRDDRLVVTPKSVPDAEGISVRVRAEFKIILSSTDARRFQLQNHKDKIFLDGFAESSDARDTLALVLRRMSDFDAQFRKKKTGQDDQQTDADATSSSSVVNLTPGQLSRRLEQTRNQNLKDAQTIETINNQRNALEAENQRLQEVKRLLKEELDSKTEENALSSKECHDRREENTRLENQLSSIEEIATNRLSELKELQQKYKATEERFYELQSENEDYQSKLRTKATVLDGVLTEHQSANQDVESLKNTLKETNGHVAQLTDENIRLKSSLEELSRKNSTKITEVDDLHTKTSTLKKEISSLQKQLSEVRSKEKRDEASIRDLKKIIRESTERESTLEDQVGDLKDSISELESVKTNLHEQHTANSDLRQKLKTTQQQLSKEQKNSFKHESQCQAITQKYETLQTKHKSQSQRMESAYQTLKHSVPKSKYEELEQELIEKQTHHEIIKAELSQLKAHREVVEQERHKLLHKTQDSEKEQNHRLEQFATERDSLKSERNFFKKKADSLSQDIKKLMHNHQNRPRGDSTSQEEFQKYQEELTDLESERDDALKAVEVYRRAFDQQLSRLHAESKRASIAKASISDHKSALKHKNRELQDLANALSDALADKDEELKRMREVSRLLGERVVELERRGVGKNGVHSPVSESS